MNDLDYRQNQKGGWDVYLNNEEFGITLWLPKGYKPEDYQIKFKTDDVSNATLRRCHNVNIEVLNTPENTKGRLSFDKYAGAHFVDNLMICVKDGFSLDFNENTLLGSSVPHSPDGFRRVYMDYFDLSHNYNVDMEKKLTLAPLPTLIQKLKTLKISSLKAALRSNLTLKMSLTSLIILTAFLRSRVMKLIKLMSKINGMKTLQYTLMLALKATQATI